MVFLLHKYSNKIAHNMEVKKTVTPTIEKVSNSKQTMVIVKSYNEMIFCSSKYILLKIINKY